MFPRHSVASQLKIFIPVGTAISIDTIMNQTLSGVDIPTVNMWCAQTSSEKNPIATVEKATALYPKIGLRAKTGRISEMIPNAGRIITYTSGCPKNQNTCW